MVTGLGPPALLLFSVVAAGRGARAVPLADESEIVVAVGDFVRPHHVYFFPRR